jgi:hypothetical protein
MVAGNPFFVIRDVIASFQPDLLALGTHARSGIAIAMVSRDPHSGPRASRQRAWQTAARTHLAWGVMRACGSLSELTHIKAAPTSTYVSCRPKLA